MSRASHYGVVAYETESSWAQNSSSWGVRLPHVGKIDVSGLVKEKQDANRLVGYRNDGTHPIPMPYSGSFTISLYLTGHGSSTATTTTIGEVETFLGYVLGFGAANGTGTTFTGGTAAAPTTTSASGLTAGGIIWAGALADSGGDGQPAVLASHTSNTATLLTALPAAPTGVCYSSVMMYPEEIAANVNVQSMRFLLSTSNLQYACWGCYPTNVEFTGLGPGEIAMVNVTFGVSAWTHKAETFPGTDTMDDFLPASNSGGSMFFNSFGTSTRATLDYRSVSINYQLGIQPIKGPGGVWAPQQDIIGAVRTRDVITLNVVVDTEAATTSPTHPSNWDAETYYHLLYSLNNAATGKRVAFYFPRLCYTGRRPVQAEMDNLNRQTLQFQAYCSTTTTTDLTLSAMRMAWG